MQRQRDPTRRATTMCPPHDPKRHTAFPTCGRSVRSAATIHPPCLNRQDSAGGILRRTHEAVSISTVPTHALASVLVVLIASAPACRSSAHEDAAARPADARAWFVDRAADSGLRFVHVNGMSGAHYFPEGMPPGAGLLDLDND